MRTALAQRPALRLVPTIGRQAETSVWFCGHCGHHHEDPDADIVRRVCEKCSMGLMLRASSAVAPGPDDAFLVVDSSLTIQAVSETAERVLESLERHAVNRHVTELLIPADAEAAGARTLAEAITTAAAGDEQASTVTVRPTGSFGVRLRASIASCGPPAAALLVFG